MTEKHPKTPHLCQCTKCIEYLTSPTAELHRLINQLVVLLNEKHRRQLVGLLASQLGQGGVSTMAQGTGPSRKEMPAVPPPRCPKENGRGIFPGQKHSRWSAQPFQHDHRR